MSGQAANERKDTAESQLQVRFWIFLAIATTCILTSGFFVFSGSSNRSTEVAFLRELGNQQSLSENLLARVLQAKVATGPAKQTNTNLVLGESIVKLESSLTTLKKFSGKWFAPEDQPMAQKELALLTELLKKERNSAEALLSSDDPKSTEPLMQSAFFDGHIYSSELRHLSSLAALQSREYTNHQNVLTLGMQAIVLSSVVFMPLFLVLPALKRAKESNEEHIRLHLKAESAKEEADHQNELMQEHQEELFMQKEELLRKSDQLSAMTVTSQLAARRFEELFQGLPISCVGFDESGVIFEWNRASTDLFGREAFMVLQSTLWDQLSDPRAIVRGKHLVKQLFKEKTYRGLRWRYTRPDGETREIQSHILPQRNLNGFITGGIAVSEDVTEKVAAVDRLELLSRIVELPSTGIFVANSEGQVIFANEGFASLSGYTSEEMQGQRFDEMLQGEATSLEAQEQLENARSKGIATSVEYLNYRKDGSTFWANLHVSPVEDARGQLQYFVAAQIDITKRIEAVEASIRSENLLRNAMDSLHEGLLQVDPNLNIVLGNKSAAALLGVDSNKLIGFDISKFKNTFYDDLTPFEVKDFPVLKAIEEGREYKDVIMGLAQPEGGFAWLNVNAIPLKHDNEEKPYGCVVSFSDVSETRAQRAQLQDHVKTISSSHQQLESRQRELEQAYTKLEALAITDGLTGLFNHRSFQERLAGELQRASEEKLSLILCDVDKFKEFNDQFGHVQGDIVLKDVAARLRSAAPEGSFVARYGGEEFAIVLPQTGRGDAVEVAESIRAEVASGSWTLRDISISLGVSTVAARKQSQQALIQEADKALYSSKHKGRNQATHFNSMLENVTIAA